MFRTVVTIVFLACLAQSALAIVESAHFNTTIRLEQGTNLSRKCLDDTPEICNQEVTADLTLPERRGFLVDRTLRSPIGRGRVALARVAPGRIWDTARPMEGSALAGLIDLTPWQGTIMEAAASMSIVDRLPPRVSDKPATLALSIIGGGWDNFAEADVRLYDHDTDELGRWPRRR